MKIPQALIPLTKEHHYSLSLAHRVIHTSNSKNATEINKLCQEIQDTFHMQMTKHFDFEENNILPLLQIKYPKECTKIKDEHVLLITLANELNEENLLEFGMLLKNHTRFEDRELFRYLTDEDLLQIGQY